MEILIVLVLMLVVVVVLGVMLTGLAGIVGIGSVAYEKGLRTRAAKFTDETLDDYFDGTENVVRYDSRPEDHLRSTVVIEGALRRGYDLVHDERGQLLFKRSQPSPKE